MSSEQLALEVEGAPGMDASLAAKVRTSLAECAVETTIAAPRLASTEAVLRLIDEVAPGWTIEIRGIAREPDGHWQCAMRPSQTTEDVEYIAHGKGPHLSNVLTAALLRAADFVRKRKSAR